MKRLISTFTFLFFATLANPVQAYVISMTKWLLPSEHGQTEVILLGDRHLPDQENHQEVFMDAAKAWAQEKGKTLVLLEGNEAYLQKSKPVSNDMLIQLSLHALKAQQGGVVQFCLADRRGLALQSMLEFLQMFNPEGLLYKKIMNLSLADGNEKFHENLTRLFEIILSPVCTVTAQECLSEIRQTADDYESFTKTNPIGYTVLSEYFARVKELHSCLERFFKQYAHDMNEPLPNIFGKYVLENKDLKFLHTLCLLFTVKSHALTDIGFAMDMLKNNNTCNRIVLLCGEFHVLAVNQWLQACAENGYGKKVFESRNNDMQPIYASVLRGVLIPDTHDGYDPDNNNQPDDTSYLNSDNNNYDPDNNNTN